MTTNGPTSLPPKNVTSNHLYLGLDKITDNIDHSKTRTENNGTTSYSVFYDKNGNEVLRKGTRLDNGQVRYSYNGIDGSGRNYQVTIEDKDGDGNFNEIMLTPEGSKTTYFLESSKDDGCFDKTSKIDLKS